MTLINLKKSKPKESVGFLKKKNKGRNWLGKKTLKNYQCYQSQKNLDPNVHPY